MTAGIQKNINLVLIVLGCSLPLLAASPGHAQTCTEAEIKANIAKFKDIDSPDDLPYQNVIRCQQDAIQSLISIVQNKQNDAKVRQRSASALGNIGQGTLEDVKVLVRVVKDKQDDTDVRLIVAEVIGEIEKGTLEDIQVLLGVIKDKQDDERVRSRAAFALKEIGKGTPEIVKTLVEVVEDKQDDARVRAHAASAIEAMELGTPEIVKTLVELVEDKQDDARVRAHAASAVGEIGLGSPEDVQVLLGVVKDKQDHTGVRRNAASAVGRIGLGSLEDVNALIRIIEDKQDNVKVRVNAAYSVGKIEAIEISTPEIVKALLRVVNDKQDHTVVRMNVASALSEIGLGTLEDVKVLIKVIEDQQDNVRVRANAASALSEIGLGTLEDVKVLIKVIEDQQDDVRVRMNAASALSEIGLGTLEDVKALLKVLKNREDDERVRGNAASAVGKIGVGTSEDVKALLKILKNQQDDANVRSIAASAVEKSEQGSLEVIKALLEVVQNKQDDAEVRNQAGFALEDISSKFVEEKDNLSIQKLEQWIELFKSVLEVQDIDKKMQNEIRTDINALERTLEYKKESQKIRQLLRKSAFGILIHALFWTGLIFLYPKSPQVQAIFFWNPKVRKIIGLWYVDLALTWVPFLRSKLFEPFRESLLSDADLESFNSQAYFAESPVKHKVSTETKPLNQAIPEIDGQIVLVGESGLGKSMFLRHLVQSSQRIVVYLPAKKCDASVMTAIQAKLHGYVKEDPNFLQSLIYSGAIDICIDGLNEVTPDTRANITKFVESNFKGNIIMTTQPIDWTPPSTSTSKIYTLQALTDEQIQEFLLSRSEFLTEATVTGEAYKTACKDYLTEIVNQQYSEEEKVAVRRMLSNPMELTLVSQMLSRGEKPDVLNLQEQQYKIMAAEYKQMHLSEFPLAKFSEAVYEMRLNDEVEISPKDWLNELKCMEHYKMVLSRQSVDLEGKPQQEWHFRHDKIQEFFIVQTFLGEPEDNRIIDHISDPRFRGVYFLLATKMPLDAAQNLREELIQYAADTKDHTVSDTFIQLLRSRQRT